MKLFYRLIYSQLDLPAHHRFPIKYQLFDMLCAHQNSNQVLLLVAPNLFGEHAGAFMMLTCHQFITGTLADKAQKRIGFSHSDAESTLQSVMSFGASAGTGRGPR